MDIEEIRKKYSSLLREKVDMLNKYLLFTSKIKEKLYSKNISGVYVHIKERQDVINEINRIDKEIEKFNQKNDPLIKESLNYIRTSFKVYYEDIKRILESISKLDRECIDLAKVENDYLKSEILKLQDSRRAAEKYRPLPDQHPRFLDIRLS